MATERYSTTNGAVSVGANSTITLVVTTDGLSNFQVFVDDGSGGTPSNYDLKAEVYSPEFDDWLHVDSYSGSSDRVLAPNCISPQMRISLTNPTTSSQNYRVQLEAY